ncbi:virulence RhuM family protein [Patescibacteria group bacterium]
MKNSRKIQLGEDKGEIVIYKSYNGQPDLRVKLTGETVWLNAHQMAQIFGVKRPAIVKHISNIYKTAELSEKQTCSKMEQVAKDGKKRQMKIYNLDMIISVGYRVNSQQATKFRTWATKILRMHVVEGYTVSKQRLLDTKQKFFKLQETIALLKAKSEKKMLHGQGKEILTLLSDYSKALTLLEGYDKGKLKTRTKRKRK